MPPGRVNFIGKVLMTPVSIKAPDEKTAVTKAGTLFNIAPAQQNKIVHASFADRATQ
jgi:hypothetical protein